MSIEFGEFPNEGTKKEILPEEGKKFIADRIEDLRAPTQKILKKLRNRIEKGEYTIIIGDDTSGRIPTLIIGGVIKELYQERHFLSPLARFIAGGIFKRGHIIISEFDKYAEKLKYESEEKFGSGHTQKILIITEFIDTGKTLEPLIINFRAKGMPCDVVTIGSKKNILQLSHFGKRVGSKIVRGQKEAPAFLRLRKEIINGVMKDYEHLFAESFRVAGYEANEEVQATVSEVRKDVKKLTRELVTWYNETYQSPQVFVSKS